MTEFSNVTKVGGGTSTNDFARHENSRYADFSLVALFSKFETETTSMNPAIQDLQDAKSHWLANDEDRTHR
eukprot:SAG31_NODE_2033_length_6618_cov_3.628624_2_plen_71_part_00